MASARPDERRIALIGEDPAILDLIDALLDGEGYRVEIVRPRRPGPSVDALDWADLIVLDFAMFAVESFALLDSLAADAATRDVPVVCLSALPWVSEEALSRPNVAGVVDKPFAVDNLLTEIERVLTDRE